MSEKLRAILHMVEDRLTEQSTWQGVGFVAGLFIARANGLEWGQASGLGGVISALLKIVFPDPAPK